MRSWVCQGTFRFIIVRIFAWPTRSWILSATYKINLDKIMFRTSLNFIENLLIFCDVKRHLKEKLWMHLFTIRIGSRIQLITCTYNETCRKQHRYQLDRSNRFWWSWLGLPRAQLRPPKVCLGSSKGLAATTKGLSGTTQGLAASSQGNWIDQHRSNVICAGFTVNAPRHHRNTPRCIHCCIN